MSTARRDRADARASSERIAKDIMNHEYMEAYRRAISFFAQTQRLASRQDAPASFTELRRAAVSMVVHIAQGANRATVAEQRPWVAAARRRARECAALLAGDAADPDESSPTSLTRPSSPHDVPAGTPPTVIGSADEPLHRPPERASPCSDDPVDHDEPPRLDERAEGSGSDTRNTDGARTSDRSDVGLESVRVRLARVLVLLIWLEAR